MRQLLHSLFIALISVIISCQEASPVIADLYVRYDQEASKIKGEATFQEKKEDGSSSSLVFQQGVAFINSGMNTLTLPGQHIRYSIEQHGRLPGDISFRIKDERGKEHIFKTKLLGIESFQAKDSLVSKANGGFIKLNGKPLEPSEMLVLLITDIQKETASFEFSNLSGHTEILVTPDMLADLSTGLAQVFLVRKRRENYQQKNYQVRAVTEYYTSDQLINIVE